MIFKHNVNKIGWKIVRLLIEANSCWPRTSWDGWKCQGFRWLRIGSFNMSLVFGVKIRFSAYDANSIKIRMEKKFLFLYFQMRNLKLSRCLNVILRGVRAVLLTTLITKPDGKGDTWVWEDDQVSAKIYWIYFEW